MPNGPDPKNDIDKLLEPFTADTGIKVDTEVVGWDVMQDRIRNAAVSGEGPDITQAGTTQVPFFAALQGFEDLSGRVEDIGGEAAYPEGVWTTTQVAGQDGIWAVPWFTEARAIYYRKDVLKKAGVAEDGAFADWDAMTRDAAGDQGQGAGDRRQADPAVRLAGQEGLRPRAPRDAVRLGRRRRRAQRGQHDVRDQLARGGRGRLVLRRSAAEGALRQEPAAARRHAGGEPVQGRPHRGLDRRPVDVRVDDAHGRRELGRRPRARTSASRRCRRRRAAATASRSSAARI